MSLSREEHRVVGSSPTFVTHEQPLPKTSTLLSVDWVRGWTSWFLVPSHFRMAELPALIQSPQLCHAANPLPQPVKPEMPVLPGRPWAACLSPMPGRTFAGWRSRAPGSCPLHLPIDNWASECASCRSPSFWTCGVPRARDVSKLRAEQGREVLPMTGGSCGERGRRHLGRRPGLQLRGLRKGRARQGWFWSHYYGD